MQPQEIDEVALDLLRRHGFGEAALPEMRGILRQAWQQRLNPDEFLCHEGDQGDSMWILVRGSIQVSKRNFQGTDQNLAQVKAPALLGHMALVDGVRRSASCKAAEVVEVATINKEEFRSLMRSNNPTGDVFRGMILASLWRQLSRGNGVLSDLLNPSQVGQLTEEQTSELLTNASATFGGWS